MPYSPQSRMVGAMKVPCLIAASIISLLQPAAAVDYLTVIGDSLTKEYQVTFPGLRIPLLGIDVDGIDELNPGARNWAEILHERRSASFNLGRFRNSVSNPLNPDAYSDLRLLGHEYNWSVPGATSRMLRLLLTDPDSSELLEDADFTDIIVLAADWRNTGTHMRAQLAGGSAASVIWCGGNDLRFGTTDPAAKVNGVQISYGTIYNGDGTGAGDPAPLMNSIRNNIKAMALAMQSANPALPMVVLAVPHVGCAPDVRATWPTDSVRTGRITTALSALNAELQDWTENTLGGAWVDVYSHTVALLNAPSYCLGGVQISNSSDIHPAGAAQSLHNRYIFSHDGFHPITSFQAVVAQAVQHKLRERWPARFGSTVQITDREIVTSIIGVPVQTGFDEFMAASGAPAGQRGALHDPDGDGLPNIFEFALSGNDPWSSRSPVLPEPGAAAGMATLRWRPLCERNTYAPAVCQQSPDLTAWTNVPAEQIQNNGDGTMTASVPAPGGAPVFLRLKVTAAP